MTRGYLTAFGPCSWRELDRDGIHTWLWCDTSGPALHHEHSLPGRPADVTHIWGWGDGTWLRARVDHSLPGGEVVGTMLTTTGTGAEVDVMEHDAPVWSVADGRVRLAPQDWLGPETYARLRQVRVTTDDGMGGLTVAPLTFVEIRT